MKRVFSTDPSLRAGNTRSRNILAALTAAGALTLAACTGGGTEAAPESTALDTTTTTSTTTTTTTTTTVAPYVQHKSSMDLPQEPVGGDYDLAANAVISVYDTYAIGEKSSEVEKMVDSISDPGLRQLADRGVDASQASAAMLELSSGFNPDFEAVNTLLGFIEDPEMRGVVERSIPAGQQLDELGDAGQFGQEYQLIRTALVRDWYDLRSEVATIFANDLMLHTTSYHQQYADAPA